MATELYIMEAAGKRKQLKKPKRHVGQKAVLFVDTISEKALVAIFFIAGFGFWHVASSKAGIMNIIAEIWIIAYERIDNLQNMKQRRHIKKKWWKQRRMRACVFIKKRLHENFFFGSRHRLSSYLLCAPKLNLSLSTMLKPHSADMVSSRAFWKTAERNLISNHLWQYVWCALKHSKPPT